MKRNPVNNPVVLGALAALVAGSAGAQTGLLQDKSLLESLQTIDGYYSQVREKLGDPGTDTAPPVPDEHPAKDTPAGVTLAPPRRDFDSVFRTRPMEGRRDGYREGRRNPFAPTSLILAAIERRGGSAANLALQPARQAIAIPRMHLRGLVNDGTDLAALLEIENAGIYIVREGDTVGLYEMGSNAVIRVREINRLNLVVEAGSLGQLFIVR
ncbi:MAG: hypothetical protein U5S82_18600 [Gammaproteobacteria bacterium]|nr:hypothetical protein [Gammaproteobacteria bacterium]